MKLKIKDLVTLDDNKQYVVVSKTDLEHKKYYYLVDMNNNENVLFCYEDDDNLVQLDDENLIIKLLPLFLKEAKKIKINNI